MHYGSEKLLDPEKHIVFNKLSRLCNIHISHSYGKLQCISVELIAIRMMLHQSNRATVVKREDDFIVRKAASSMTLQNAKV